MTKLFKTFALQFPRLATLQDDSLHLRAFPQDGEGQTKMHNDCMTAVRLQLKTVSEARVKWMSVAASKRELEGHAVAEPALGQPAVAQAAAGRVPAEVVQPPARRARRN